MRLRLSIALGDQETATSFTSRLAAANGVTAGEFCRDWGFTFGKVVVGDPEAVAKIAELGGVDAGALQASAFVSDARRIRRGGEVLTRLSMRNGKFAVCPACLRSDIRGNKDPDLEPEAVVYGRAPWRIDAVRTCAAHKLALVVFPDHTRGHGQHDFAASIAGVLPKLGALTAGAAKRRPNGLEAYVIGRMARSARSEFLDGIGLFAAIRVCEVFGAVALFGLKVNMRNLPDDKLLAASGRGFDIFDRGPSAIRDFLDQLYETAGDRDRKDGPRVVFGRIYEWLMSHAGDPAYDRLRTVVGRHVLDKFPLGANTRLFGAAVRRQVRHSIRTLSLETGAHPKRMRKLLRTAGVIGEDQMALSDHNVRFDAEAGASVVRAAESSLSLAATQIYLNAPRSQTDVLVKSGIIVPHLPASAAGGYDRYAVADLDAFLARLAFGAKPVVRPKPLEVGIQDAAKQACCSAADIVRLIQERKLPWTGRLRGTNGYLGVLVRVDQVRNALPRPVMDGIPLEVVRRKLATNHRVLLALIANKHLATYRAMNPINKCSQTVVAPAELERFQTTYVSLHVLAKERGLHHLAMKKALDKQGIEPALDHLKIHARFYLRKDC
jgi:hypothetical protein